MTRTSAAAAAAAVEPQPLHVCCRLRYADRIIRYIETLEQFAIDVWMRFHRRNGLYMHTSSPYQSACSCELNLPLWRFDEFAMYGGGGGAGAGADDNDTIDMFVSISEMYQMLRVCRESKNTSIMMTTMAGGRLEMTVMTTTQQLLPPPPLASATKYEQLPVEATAAADDTTAAAATVGGDSQILLHFTLQSNVAPSAQFLSQFVVPSDFSPDRSHVRIRMDTTAMNSIARHSSVLDGVVHVMFHQPTQQLGFYSHGESGECMERVRCTVVPHIEAPTYLGPSANFGGAAAAAADAPTQQQQQFTNRCDIHAALYAVDAAAAPRNQWPAHTVGECISNRFIKFFKTIHPAASQNHSSLVMLQFGPDLPLQMRIDIPPPQHIASMFASAAAAADAGSSRHQLFMRTNIAPWRDEDHVQCFRTLLTRQRMQQQHQQQLQKSHHVLLQQSSQQQQQPAVVMMDEDEEENEP